MRAAQPSSLSEAQYLVMEAAAKERHEYVAGQVFAIAGGSQRHNRIALNLASGLLSGLKSRPCQVFMSDVKLHVARESAYYYPDVMVTCAQTPMAANDTQVVSDPVLVVEVLSPGTEAIDRREKLNAYRRLPALREYALVSQDSHQVEIYRRIGEAGQDIANWLYVTYEPGDEVVFESVAVTLPIAGLYAGTDLDAGGVAAPG